MLQEPSPPGLTMAIDHLPATAALRVGELRNGTVVAAALVFRAHGLTRSGAAATIWGRLHMDTMSKE